MAAKTDDINKKAAKLAEKQTEKGKEMQQYEEVRSQLQTIMSEQQNNLALEKQDMGNQAQLTETLSKAGAMAAAGGVGGGIAAQPQVVGPSTTETLQKFGMKPGTTVTHGHNVQNQPNKITVNNTYNNTTTNNTTTVSDKKNNHLKELKIVDYEIEFDHRGQSLFNSIDIV